MKAVFQKMQLNPFDKADTVQFRVDNAQLEDIRSLRRGMEVRMSMTERQSSISDEGELIYKGCFFSSDACSISICCLEEEQIATITFTVENKTDTDRILNSGLRGKVVDLTFSK